MREYSLFIIVIGLLLACDSPENQAQKLEVVENEAETSEKTIANQRVAQVEIEKEDTSFSDMLTQLTTAEAVTEYNQMIDPNLGVYLISSNGAMPRIEKTYEINTGDLTKQIKTEVQFEDLPSVVCDEFAYNKQGCFAQEKNPLKESQIWNYCDLNEKEKQAIIALAERVNYTVIDTESYTYYFSYKENKWTLSFIDLRIPCQG